MRRGDETPGHLYFTGERQGRILGRLHFALQEDGHLVLGRAEMLLSHPHLFLPSDLGRRIFRKVTDTHLRFQLLTVAETGARRGRCPRAAATALGWRPSTPTRWPRPWSRPTGACTSPTARPWRCRPAPVRPRAALPGHRAVLPPHGASLPPPAGDGRGQPVHAGEVRLDRDGPVRRLDVRLTPVVVAGGVLGVSLTFHDVTSAKRLQHELEHSNLELDTAYAELQSTNSELNAMNEELRQKTRQLDQVNGYLESILATLRAGVVVVDRDLVVVIWSEQAQELWGLRVEEAQGAHLLNLDIGLPVEELRTPVRAAIADGRGTPSSPWRRPTAAGAGSAAPSSSWRT